MASQALKRKNKNQKNANANVQAALERKLERLKKVTGLGQDLRVVWAPDPDSKIHGECKENKLYIYDEDEKVALETLKHDFLHYHIHKRVVEPLVKHINLQKALIEDLIYSRVEELVDKLSKLL